MRLLTDSQQQQIADKIHDTESRTDAELVAVIAQQSDDYFYIPALWSALLALLIPLPLIYLTEYSSPIIYFVQLLVFIVCTWVLQQDPFQSKVIPRRVKVWRAANMARRQFLEQSLHHTRDDIGLLIFVSEAEHYVEILADRGISKHIDDKQWQSIIDNFTTKVRSGDTLNGFLGCIEECGALLEQHIPVTGQKNELPNRLVMI